MNRSFSATARSPRQASSSLPLANVPSSNGGTADFGDPSRSGESSPNDRSAPTGSIQPLRVVTSDLDRHSDRALMAADDLHKSYRKGDHQVAVLRGVEFEVEEGEFVAIVGQSGSGKSTLLHLLATLDAADQGTISFRGRTIESMTWGERERMRNEDLGMVFQFYHLLPELSTLENVLLPAMISTSWWNYLRRRRALEARASELLDRVGLCHRRTHRPRELSGGEMQRAAVARALLNDPQLLLADEPTGNLDQETGAGVMEMLRSLNSEHNLTIVMVTHDAHVAQQADRTVLLAAGQVADIA